MSIESFRELSPSQVVERVHEKHYGREGYRTLGKAFSIPFALALTMKEEGTEGLRSGGDPNLNYAGVVFGVSSRSLEMILKDGFFDLDYLISDYNEAIKGCNNLKSLKTKNAERIELPQRQMKRITHFAKEYKKPSIFFRDGEAYKPMPLGWKEFLEVLNIRPFITTWYLALYEERLKLFSPANSAIALPAKISTVSISEDTTKTFENMDAEWEIFKKKLKLPDNPPRP